MTEFNYEDFMIPESENSGRNFRSLLFSIFLLMLSFFIVLNSISRVDNSKRGDSLRSVQDKFSQPEDAKLLVRPQGEIKILEQEKVNLPGVALNYFGESEKIAREQIELVRGRIVTDPGSMRLLIPIDSFFVKDSSQIQDFQQQFLKRLADQMVRYPRLDIEFSLPSVGTPPYNGQNLAVVRASAFAEAMAKLGIKEGEIYSGIKPADGSDNITLEFFLRGGEKTGAEGP